MVKENILVLGGTSDLGLAVALLFAELGYPITITSRDSNALEANRAMLQAKSTTEVHTAIFDATDVISHKDFYDRLVLKPNIVFCVFGYLGDQKTAQNDWAETEKILLVNFVGAVSILNIVAAEFERKKAGCIIGVSSVAGERGRKSNYLYGSAKAGFTTYLSGLRNRLFESNVQVISVLPGFLKTKMIAGIETPKVLTANPATAAKSILKAYQQKKNVIYIYQSWYWIFLIIRSIPEFIFKRLNL
jgi:decaprenylphospho-beta-D-erythro-pentofuranosid-2-ulose 2-reductase